MQVKKAQKIVYKSKRISKLKEYIPIVTAKILYFYFKIFYRERDLLI